MRYNLKEIKQVLEIARPNQFNQRFITVTETKTYDDYWQLDWKEFIVACDTHSPFVHKRMLNLMLKMAEKYKIPNFIHAGDFWNQDTFSTWWVAREDMVTFSKEVKESKNIVKSLNEVFENVHFFLGSHDLRFWRLMYSIGKSDDYMTVWDLLENDKIKTSSYRYAEIGTEWRINHPKNTVKVGGLPAVRMGAKFGRSIVFGHGHWWGIIGDPSGKHYLCAPGCLCDSKKIAYKNLWDTSHDEWKNGFLYVENGNIPHLIDEKIAQSKFGIKG